MKKKIVIVLVSILAIIGIYFLYQFIRIKTAKVEITYIEDKNIDFLSDTYVSTLIKSINGKIVDNYKIDTTKLGKKEINYEYVNEDNIKLKQSVEINIVDREAPLVWLGKSYNITVGDTSNLLDKILCGDNYDNNPVCEIEGFYNVSEKGSYDLTFKATDSSNNVTEKKFTLNVVEPRTSSSASKNNVLFSDIVKEYKNKNTQIGIDVSKWQQDIDFNALKEAGVEFVFIRVGSSSGINGENYLDSKFIQNISNANAVGIPVGIYFYSYANTYKRAVSDALWVIDKIKDYKVDLNIAFDWENWNSFNDFDLSFFGLTNIAEGFMKTVEDHGYKGLLYSSKLYLEKIWQPTSYPVWLAHYTKNTDYQKDYEYWQICSNGKVNGINGDVDIDIRYLN